MRLTKSSDAVIKLREKLERGELKGTEDPKQVWLSEPLFQMHKIENFRTCWNNLKKEFKNSNSVGMFFSQYF